MVNSKKMSKSTVAIVLLSLLLVLSLILTATGAWFTATKDETAKGTDTNVKFGTLGAVTLTITDATWQEHANGASGLTAVSGRSYYMPGDEVIGAGLKIEYADAGSEAKVYYLISDGTKYYTLNSTDNKLVEATTAAGEINKGASIEIRGQVATVTADGVVYKLDGVVDGTAGSSGAITNTAQGKSLDTATVTLVENGKTYTVTVIQSTNLNAEGAYTLLTK